MTALGHTMWLWPKAYDDVPVALFVYEDTLVLVRPSADTLAAADSGGKLETGALDMVIAGLELKGQGQLAGKRRKIAVLARFAASYRRMTEHPLTATQLLNELGGHGLQQISVPTAKIQGRFFRSGGLEVEVGEHDVYRLGGSRGALRTAGELIDQVTTAPPPPPPIPPLPPAGGEQMRLRPPLPPP